MAANKKKDENINEISGIAGLIHKIVMFITYPFRKPLRCLFFVAFIGALAYFLPIYMYNVPQKEVYNWYLGRFKDVKEQIIVPYVQKGTDALVDTMQQPTSQSIGRKTFSKSSSTGYKVDVLSEEASDVVNIEDIRRAEENAEAPRLPVSGSKNYNDSEVEDSSVIMMYENEKSIVETSVDYSKIKGEYSGLDYLDKIVTIEGEAEIHNVNELSVDGVYVFLYGIYAEPQSYEGVKGREFLKNLIGEEKIRCDVLAYTQDGRIATAECYINNIDINKALVLQGFSKRAPR